jgi:uncharacterized protein
MRTLAVIADTHLPRGSRRLADDCVERLRAADLVIHAGDFSTRGAYDELVGLCRELVAVHGNVDDFELRARLPERIEVEVDGARIGVVHDAGPARGRLARLRRGFPHADVVVFGHSHMPVHEAEGNFQIFNPGSPTERRRAPHRTIGVGEVSGGRVILRHRMV